MPKDRSSSLLILSQGKSTDEAFDDDEDNDDDINGKRMGSANGELQSTIDQQQKQIDQLMALMKQQQQQHQPPQSPPTVTSTFSTTPVLPNPSQPAVATAAMNPLKAMLFVDGTWLYYSIHEREFHSCPIIQRYGRGWQRRYYFDWSALPRVICQALQQEDPGWAAQSRPVEISRVSVFTSYKADTSPNSYRFQMYQEMSNANYDVHMMETLGRNEKCVDINIAVDMLHYATVPNAYDVALLLTGDKDFIPAMIRTRQKGRRVGLVSMRRGCNRALCETPTDSNNNNEHNHNIRDYDVVWIEDYLDELIKPKREGADDPDSNAGDLTTFTFTKILSDFISQSGMSRVNSRDIGRYLKLLTIGDQSLLDELKITFGGLRQFFTTTSCFFLQEKSEFERGLGGRDDRSYWVGMSSDADMTLMEAAKTAKLSAVEKQFFDSYSLEPLDNKEFAYFQSLKLTGQIGADRETPDYSPDGGGSNYEKSSHSRANNVDDEQLVVQELPEHLIQDYSHFTVPKLKEYCVEYGLKVSGNKAELLDRIQEYIDGQTKEIKNKGSGQPHNPLIQSADETPEYALPEDLTQDFSTMTLVNLKGFCRSKGLKVSGTKADLLDRIRLHVEAEMEALERDKQANQVSGAHSMSPEGHEQLDYLAALVMEFVKASGGKANSRELGRYLSVNKASPTRLSSGFNSDRSKISALTELKERHGSIQGYVKDQPHIFDRCPVDPRELVNPSDPANKHAFYVVPKGSSQAQTYVQNTSSGPEAEAWGYLESLVAGYVRARGGKANSRDLGTYLNANKASPRRLAVPDSLNSGNRVSALHELKEKHGNLLGFVIDRPSLFERQEVDPNEFSNSEDPHNRFTFYIAIKEGSPALT